MRAIGCLLVICCMVASGCNASDRITSTGRVTLNGQPVEVGLVVFRPIDQGLAAKAATITGGRFVIKTVASRFRVEIRGMRPIEESKIPKTMPRMEGVPVHEDYIPAAYNTESTLEVEVTKGGENSFEFDLSAPMQHR
jgi:hypothetical protein